MKFKAFTPLLESGRALRSSQDGSARNYKGVTIIEAGLGNRKDRHFYSVDALRRAVDKGLFNNLRAFADHPTSLDEEVQPERTVRDFAGLYTRPRFVEARGARPARVVADLRILKAHRWLSDTVDELVEMGQADKIGISINGEGRTAPKRVHEAGETVEVNEVLDFVKLRSADIVTEAGAGGGFQHLLESARQAGEESSMSRAELLKALKEAAAKQDKAAVLRLTDQITEAWSDDESEDESPCAKLKGSAKRKCEDKEDMKEAAARKVKGKKTKSKAAVDDDEDLDDEPVEEDGVDHDAELQAAVEEAAEGGDGDDAADEDAATTEEADDDEDDEDEDDEDAADAVAEADEEEDETSAAKQRRLAKTHRTREVAGKALVHARRPKNVRGVPAKGTGTAVKPAGKGRGQPAQRPRTLMNGRTKESDQERLLLRENARLRMQLDSRNKADLASKLLKESDVPPGMRPGMVSRLVSDCPDEKAMRREIQFAEQMVSAAVQRTRESLHEDDEEFMDVEGSGSRVRESYNGSSGDEDNFEDLFEGAGIPMKALEKGRRSH